MNRSPIAVGLLLAACSFEPKAPTIVVEEDPVCGDGRVQAGEACDDDNGQIGDGCIHCQVTPGWICDDSSPTVCTNPPPIARPDTLSVARNTTADALVLANDGDPRDEAIKVVSVVGANFGTTVVHADRITYTAGAQVGVDSLDYTISDAAGFTATARLTVRVDTPNRVPVAEDIDVTVPADTTSAIQLVGRDADNEPLRYEIVTPPQNGMAMVAGNARAVYAPTRGYGGPDSFEYVVHDSESASTPGTVRIQVGGAWWDSAWGRRRRVRVNTNGVLPSDELPVRVPIDVSALTAEGARADGSDLRFISLDDATELSYEIVAWETAAAAAWVTVPSVTSARADFWMYYSNPNPPARTAAKPFDAGYEFVYHLDGTFSDSVNGTTANGMRSYVDTIAGRGLQHADEERTTVPNGSGNVTLTNGGLCMWLTLSTASDQLLLWRIERTSSGQGDGGHLQLQLEDDGRISLELDNGNNVENFASGAAYDDNAWHWVCATWPNQALRLVVDGNEAATGNGFDSFEVESIVVGSTGDTNYRGPFDELWLLTTERTDAWMLGQYRLISDDRVSVAPSSEQP